MFTSVLECVLKPKKRGEFDGKVCREILPSLRREVGFVDVLAVMSDGRGEHTFTVTLWICRSDAVRYQREHGDDLLRILQPLLTNHSTLQWQQVGGAGQG